MQGDASGWSEGHCVDTKIQSKQLISVVFPNAPDSGFLLNSHST